MHDVGGAGAVGAAYEDAEDFADFVDVMSDEDDANFELEGVVAAGVVVDVSDVASALALGMVVADMDSRERVDGGGGVDVERG